MSTAAHAETHGHHGFRTFVLRGVAGAVAGIGGGIIFGILMAMMGMLTMVAMLVRSDSVVVGGLVHLIISAGFGALFAELWRGVRLPCS